MEADLDDAHLCIKCNLTIVGLDSYIAHRKRNCAPRTQKHEHQHQHELPSEVAHSSRAVHGNEPASPVPHNFDNFAYPEPEVPSTHGGKGSKALADSYDLPYDLGADVFFSSLQLQSVQSCGKTGGGQASHTPHHHHAHQPDPQQSLLKAVSAMSDVKKPFEAIFKPLDYGRDSPEVEGSEGDAEAEAGGDPEPEPEPEAVPDDEDDDVDVDVGEDSELEEEDEEEYDTPETGGKWKLSPMRHSPPVVPAHFTGGKWKPEHRPQLRASHTQLAPLSPQWAEEQQEPAEAVEEHEAHEPHESPDQFPPADHTKGKWVPGTKLRPDFKPPVRQPAENSYWCNICCRRLKNKWIYDQHLQSKYHRQRAECEQHLEKASLPASSISKRAQAAHAAQALLAELEPLPKAKVRLRQRNRRFKFIKCALCKYTMLREHVGKHLISHYHYRRMQSQPQPEKCIPMILDSIHSIVLQSPFQCRPCRFYANTEQVFLLHWNSLEHRQRTERMPGRFWCSYCRFGCADNETMAEHLVGSEHGEVVLALNRSVPICIAKLVPLHCQHCGLLFRYNMELLMHMRLTHPHAILAGTISDRYQRRFWCMQCGECLRSQVALQRHGKFKHSIVKFVCTICRMEFGSECEARRHRNTAMHRRHVAEGERGGPTQGESQSRQSPKLVARTGKRTHAEPRGPGNEPNCEPCEPDNEPNCEPRELSSSTEIEQLLHELIEPEKQDAPEVLETVVAASKSSAKGGKAGMHVLVRCKDCTEVFESREALKVHRDACHPLLSHVCMKCGESFPLAQSLGRHSRICKPTPWQDGGGGTEAPQTFASSSSTATKARRTTGTTGTSADKAWVCDECGFRAPLESELMFHRLHHTYGTLQKHSKYPCPVCAKPFLKYSLRCHLRQHTNEKIFECSVCQQKFSRRHNLKDHMKNLHSEPAGDDAGGGAEPPIPFECPTCGKCFKTKYGLKAHSIIHGGPETEVYDCPEAKCRYATRTKGLLRIHMASHLQKTVKCTYAGCDYVGKSDMHLKRHSQTHVERVQRFQCEKCEFRTHIRTNLRRHQRVHNSKIKKKSRRRKYVAYEQTSQSFN